MFGQGTPVANSNNTLGPTNANVRKARLYNPLERTAFTVLKKIKESNAYATAINSGLLSTQLPIGIVKEIGGTKYVLAIDSAQRKGNNWVLSAYMAVLLPQGKENSEIVFAAKNIGFNPLGIGGTIDERLELVSTNEIDISDDLAVEFSKTGGVSNNYIGFDCNGYKDISLEGKFKFSKNLLLPAGPASAVGGVAVANGSIVSIATNFVIFYTT